MKQELIQMEEENAEFQVQDILPLSLTIVVAGIGMAYGLNVLGDVRNDVGDIECTDNAGYWNENTYVCQVSASNTTVKAANGAAFNASSEAVTAVAKFPEKLGLIVTVVVAAILIGILVRYLLVR